jgi:hypothetical protein
MIRSPRETLTAAVAQPRSLALAVLIVVIAAACSAGFLVTRVGQLAALDQQVRQLESFGVYITDERYEALKQLLPYRPAIAAILILVGWPLLWLFAAKIVHAIGNRLGRPHVSFAQVLTVIVHASAVLAARAVVSAPINYARESLGGATSVSMIAPALGESTFAARLLGAVDVFIVWWVVLVAMGFGILYRTRTLPIARWLFGAYVAAAVAVAVTQALRGGI